MAPTMRKKKQFDKIAAKASESAAVSLAQGVTQKVVAGPSTALSSSDGSPMSSNMLGLLPGSTFSPLDLLSQAADPFAFPQQQRTPHRHDHISPGSTTSSFGNVRETIDDYQFQIADDS